MASKKKEASGASPARRARREVAESAGAARGVRSQGASTANKKKAAAPTSRGDAAAAAPSAPERPGTRRAPRRAERAPRTSAPLVPKPARKKTATRKTAASRATRRAPSSETARSRRNGAARARTTTARRRRQGGEAPAGGPAAIAGLAEEDQIRAAKFLPRELARRLFEEERFLFPDSYGVDRVRLLVRDPDWIFAYWDVNSDSMKDLARSLGERAFALSRLTLRVVDPVSGGSSDILLPPGSRWWYIRTDAARRAYRAQIGVTLPSGEFRRLAESNTVVTPRVGPSPEAARRRISYREAAGVGAREAAAAGRAERERGLVSEPWKAERVVDGASSGRRGGASDAFRPSRGREAQRGGASDVNRPGASDAFRPGASDTHRR